MTDTAAADAAAASAQELADLFEQPVTLELAGKALRIAPLTIRQTGRVASILKTIMASGEKAWELDIASLVADYCDQMIAVVAVATGEPEKWVGELRADDFVELATIVFRVNANFFLARVGPRLAAVAPVLGTVMTWGLDRGASSSRTSSSMDTATPPG